MKNRFYSTPGLAAFAMSALAGLTVVSSAGAAAINYRESWDSYAQGQVDPTYTSVWNNISGGSHPPLGAGTISTPNAILLDNRNRVLVNSLTDGITNGVPGYSELSAGQKVVATAGPLVADPLTTTNLQLRWYATNTANNQRAKNCSYMELGLGSNHAPVGALGLDPLGSAIPLLALGKLNALTTSSGGANAGNTSIYFFNGIQWIRAGNVAAGLATEVYAEIFYNSGLSKWQAHIEGMAPAYVGVGSTFNNIDLAIDPSALGSGFDTVSWGEYNVNPITGTGIGIAGGTSADDVWVLGGDVVPEPATLGLLCLGGLVLARRRR